MNDYRLLIAGKCVELRDFLLGKFDSYGNSAFEPVRIFSDASPVEQLRVRIDDKISRLKNKGLYSGDDDDLRDLTGYLILLMIAEGLDT